MARFPIRWLSAAVALLLLGQVLAQVASGQSAPGADEDAVQELGAVEAVRAPGETEGDEVFGELTSAPPGIFSVGLSAGFPSYQTIALNASIQAQYVGLQLKGSWTAVGPYFGAQLRAYPPIPIPVPIFIGVGGGVYGDNLSYHAAVGAHVPLSKNLRLDLEGGVANVPVLAERGWAPHLAVGVSYAFPVDLSTATRGDTSEVANSTADPAHVSPSCAEPREADARLLSSAVELTVTEWLRSAQATFGSVYKDLSYSYRITGSSVNGNTARASVQYSGSVTEILTGTRHSATGTASASYAWNGCRWVEAGVEY